MVLKIDWYKMKKNGRLNQRIWLWYTQLGQPHESSTKRRAEFARCLISINFPHHLMLLADTLSSDHLPILIRLQMMTTTTPGLRRTYVNLKKANWDRYRQEVEASLSKAPNCHRHFSASTLLICRDRQSRSVYTISSRPWQEHHGDSRRRHY